MKTITYNLDDLPRVANKVIENADSKILLFYGNMGVGKTTLIKELVKQLGSDDVVSSPTFSLVNQYQAGEKSFFHFDFYRIEDEFEALDIGIEEYFDSGSWVFIEWPEKIKTFLPKDAQEIRLKRTHEGHNTLTLIEIKKG